MASSGPSPKVAKRVNDDDVSDSEPTQDEIDEVCGVEVGCVPVQQDDKTYKVCVAICATNGEVVVVCVYVYDPECKAVVAHVDACVNDFVGGSGNDNFAWQAGDLLVPGGVSMTTAAAGIINHYGCNGTYDDLEVYLDPCVQPLC